MYVGVIHIKCGYFGMVYCVCVHVCVYMYVLNRPVQNHRINILQQGSEANVI